MWRLALLVCLLRCAYSAERVWAGGWLVLGGLACVSGDHLAVRRNALLFLLLVSPPLAGWLRLVLVAAVLEEQQELKVQGPFRPRLSSGFPATVISTTSSWPKQVISQSRMGGMKDGKTGSTSQWEEPQCIMAPFATYRTLTKVMPSLSYGRHCDGVPRCPLFLP